MSVSSISLTGIQTAKKIIEAVSNNIANSDNDAYVRLENHNYELAPSQHSGGGVATYIDRPRDRIIDDNVKKTRFKLAEETAMKDGADLINTVASNSNLGEVYTDAVNAAKNLQLNPTNPSLIANFESTKENWKKASENSKNGFSNLVKDFKQKIELSSLELEAYQTKFAELTQSGSDAAYVETDYVRSKITELQGTISGYNKVINQLAPKASDAFKSVDLIASYHIDNYSVDELASVDIDQVGDEYGKAKTVAGTIANTSLLGQRYALADYTSAQEVAKKAYGVDLTTEMVKLKQYQSYYEANMQVFSVSDQMLGTLLNIVAR